MQPGGPAVDFMIITALEEERSAVLALLAGHRQLERDGRAPHTYYEAQVRSRRADGAVYRVLVTSLAGMGPIQAAAQAVAVVHRWQPRHVLMVGIAGGAGSGVGLGDVLVASQIADYTVGKQTPEQRQVRWEVHRADADLLDAANNFSRGWEELLTRPRPVEGSPRRHLGVILSGGDVIADARVIQSNQEVWDKLVGVDMEGGGVALALHTTQERPRFLMIRGVSDFADEKKNSAQVRQWREYACDVAAAYAVGLIRGGLIAPAPVAAPPETRVEPRRSRSPPKGLTLPTALAVGLLAAGAWVWSHSQGTRVEPAPARSSPPPPSPAPQPAADTKPPPPPASGEAVEVRRPSPGLKARVPSSPAQPLARPTCRQEDRQGPEGDWRAYCLCEEKIVKISSPFPTRTGPLRERVLGTEQWSCSSPPPPSP